MDIIILISTCAINLVLGLFVLLRDTKKAYSRLFISVSVLMNVWILTNYAASNNIINLALTNVANKLAFASGFSVVLAGLLFTYTYPVRRKVSLLEGITLGVTSVLTIGFSMTESVAGVVSLDPTGELKFSTGTLIWVLVLGLALAVILMARNLLTVSRKVYGEIKERQARLILLAFGGTALLGILLNIILPVLVGNWDSTRYGPLVTVLLVATIAYSIVKHGLFDIRFAVVRGVAYVFSLATLAGLYYLAAYALSRLLVHGDGTSVISQSPLSIGLALVLAFIFQPVKRFFDHLTNNIFFHDNYDADDFLARLGKELSATSDLRSLLQRASDEISRTIQAEYGFFFVRYGNDSHMSAGTTEHGRISLREVKLLDGFVESHDSSPIVVDLLSDDNPVHPALAQQDIALVLPLIYDGASPNYLFVGHRRSRQYTQRDVRTLSTIANELVIAIQNALSVQEVKDINATLQERIRDATKELRTSNLQLQRLDETKDEFISMASHQLRTPLTSIKGYISMVLEGDVGKISKTQSKLLGEAYTSSERMVHLIGDFLNVSRLQTGKFLLESKMVDLAKVVGQEVDSLRTTAQAHNMKLEYRLPAYFPILYIDEGKIRQVLMNFMDNSIYYSREHTTITIKLSVEDGNAVATVHDTGIGVPKAEQAHLFTKFFRATNARKQRPDGTGVGLFLAKKVIDAHGGSIVFESVEGEGSTFGFRLPIKKLSATPKEVD